MCRRVMAVVLVALLVGCGGGSSQAKSELRSKLVGYWSGPDKITFGEKAEEIDQLWDFREDGSCSFHMDFEPFGGKVDVSRGKWDVEIRDGRAVITLLMNGERSFMIVTLNGDQLTIHASEAQRKAGQPDDILKRTRPGDPWRHSRKETGEKEDN